MALATIALCLVSPTLAPQSPDTAQYARVPSQPKYAGIYHVSTSTWTRISQPVANLGPDVIYSNTAQSGYFTITGGAGSQFPGSTNIDEGGLPGTTNGNSFAGMPNRDSYTVNCVQIGYCDFGAAGSNGWTIGFYNDYIGCTSDLAPDDLLTVTGLPASGCWLVDLDLTGNEVCMTADGDGIWDNDPALDTFGWSHVYAGSDGAPGNTAGFLITGNPAVTDPTYLLGGLPLDGSNTYYGATNCPGVGTGYLTRDFWWLEDPTVAANTGCYFFGGYSNNNGSCTGPSNPYASFWFELAADTGTCDQDFGTIYCASNPNSTGVNTGIRLLGSELAADDDVTLVANNMPTNSFGFFIVSETQGLVMNPAGSQGNLCVLGAVGRFVGMGQIKNSGPAGEISLSTQLMEWTLTAIPTPTGPRMAMAGSTDNFQAWHRDTVMGQATSNFSDGITVTWQ